MDGEKQTKMILEKLRELGEEEEENVKSKEKLSFVTVTGRGRGEKKEDAKLEIGKLDPLGYDHYGRKDLRKLLILKMDEDRNNEIVKWKNQQEQFRDPKGAHNEKKRRRQILNVPRKRRRLSYWDLTPSDMLRIGVPMRNMVGISSFANMRDGRYGGDRDDPKPRKSQTKRIYVGGIPNSVTEEDLQDLFNAKMIQMGLMDNPDNKEPCVGCKINYQKSFCFLDFRTEGEATNCLQLNGLRIQDQNLRVKRPTDYSNTETQASTTALEKKANLTTVDLAISDILNLNMTIESAICNLRHHFDLKIERTKYLVLLNILTMEDLAKDITYNELINDLRVEAQKYGDVEGVVVPRPKKDGFTNGFGKVFIAYEDSDMAENARKNFQGKIFQGRTCVTSFTTKKEFEGLKTISEDGKTIYPEAFVKTEMLVEPEWDE